MNWCVVRHPHGGSGVIPESALELHEGAGWVRVSDFAEDQTLIDPARRPAPKPGAAIEGQAPSDPADHPAPAPKPAAKASSKES